jgi:hypothetical protein
MNEREQEQRAQAPLEELLDDAIRRQEERQDTPSDPDVNYRSASAQRILQEKNMLSTNQEDQQAETSRKLERIFTAIWANQNPESYMGRFQSYVFQAARQLGLPFLYDRKIDQIRKDPEKTLAALTDFIALIKKDNILLQQGHADTLTDIEGLRKEYQGHEESLAQARLQATKLHDLYTELSQDEELLKRDMDLARRNQNHDLYEAQSREARNIEHDLLVLQGELSKLKLEIESGNLRLPYLDQRIRALYQSVDSIDEDVIAHSEYLILIETAHDLIADSLKAKPEQSLGEVKVRYDQSGTLIDAVYQNLPRCLGRPRMLGEPKAAAIPRKLSQKIPTTSVHDRIKNIFDDIATLGLRHDGYVRERMGGPES